ncbi:HU family DNA-binding protein [Burkholderia cenocepacia]|uniref:HU family DNA-binding protein n=1 Tax=Burkholderia cenocepacia TaxID=95486 RepID=UPI0007619596|nr:HU family DNA-binding protein [Burkholderia cenocepacia]KWU26315.1 hypothetical protein AS149_25325 [Burkholderia cenocepacia]
MTKTELIAAIAQNADLTQGVAEKALNSALQIIQDTVAGNGDVTLVGFGTFSQGARAERQGRNPSTGAEITIPAAKTVKFSAGKAFKDAVNK